METLNIKDSLSKVKIYGRYLSEFLLPDQVDILAKSLQKDIEQKLTLTDVSQQRELLNAMADNFNESTHTYVGQPMIKETLKAFNCG